MASAVKHRAIAPTSTERAPWFVATLIGPRHEFHFANDCFRTTYGARDYEGQSVNQLFPEMSAQVYPDVLDRAYGTGCRVDLKSSPIKAWSQKGGPLIARLIDVSYIPPRDGRGHINGIYLEGHVATPTHLDQLCNHTAVHGLKTLADRDVLALLIYQQSQDQEALGIADQLLDRFDGLGGVLAASMADLDRVSPLLSSEGIRSLKMSTALHLKLVREFGRRVLKQKIVRRQVLSSSALVRSFLSASLRHEPREEFHVLFLDHGLNLIADEVMGQGSIAGVAVYSREVIRRALELSASALILVHNHPSGSEKVSPQDQAITAEIVRAGQALGIAVHDHLIVAGNSIVSFRASGLLSASGSSRLAS